MIGDGNHWWWSVDDALLSCLQSFSPNIKLEYSRFDDKMWQWNHCKSTNDYSWASSVGNGLYIRESGAGAWNPKLHITVIMWNGFGPRLRFVLNNCYVFSVQRSIRTAAVITNSRVEKYILLERRKFWSRATALFQSTYYWNQWKIENRTPIHDASCPGSRFRLGRTSTR